MSAMVRVDGVPRRLLGLPCPQNTSRMPTVGLPTVYPTRTVFRFRSREITINMTFATPMFVEDLDSFRPRGLVTVDVASVDGREHEVSLYFDVAGQLATQHDGQPVAWGRDTAVEADGRHVSMGIGTAEQAIFRVTGDWNSRRSGNDGSSGYGQPSEHLQWGRFHLGVPNVHRYHK